MKRDYVRQYEQLYRAHWWWRAREELVLDVLRALDLPGHAEILDVGCGDGWLFGRLERFGSVRGIEVNRELLDPDGPHRDRIHTQPLGHGDYRGWRFDLITALDVIEHIEDAEGAIAQMVRMLRPGGYLLLTIPALMSLWSHHDEINDHYHRYDAHGIRRLLGRRVCVLQIRYLFHALYFPKLLIATIERLRHRRGASRSIRQHALPHAAVSSFLRSFFVREGRLLGPLRLPFGSSVLVVARAPRVDGDLAAARM